MKRVLLMVMMAGLFSAACSKASGGATYYESGGYDTFAGERAASGFAQEASRTRSAAPAYEAAPGLADESGQPDALPPETQNERKLIKNALFRIRVADFDNIGKLITEFLDQYHGYASSTTARENVRNYTLKIPSTVYDDAVKGLQEIGVVMYYSEHVEDATIRFYDMDGRLRTKQELLKTFQGYLGQAKNIEEIMTVEKRIAELQQEIDWLGSQLANLSHLADYATIELEVYGPSLNTPSYKPGIGERVGSLLKSFGDFLSTVLVALTGLIVYGIPCVLLLAALIWLLFGKVGLLKRLWRLVMKKSGGK